MRIRETLDDCFDILEPGSVLMRARFVGMPKVGMVVQVQEKNVPVRKVGANSTDGKAVSMRFGVTGQPVPPLGAIAITKRDAKTLDRVQPRGTRIEEAFTHV